MEQLKMKIAVQLFDKFVFFKEFPSSSIPKYLNALIWIETEFPISDVQLLSFVARAYFAVGVYTKIPECHKKAEKCIEQIKSHFHENGHFGGPKQIHRAYFSLKAIKDVEGENFDRNSYVNTLDWLKKTVNSDGGWSNRNYASTQPEVVSDVETTSTAIQILCMFLEQGGKRDSLNIIVEKAVDCLLGLKGKHLAWGETKNQSPNIHATTHAIRAIIAAEPFIRNEIRNSITDSLMWIKKIQKNGAWGNDENAITQNLSDTTLTLTALNRIHLYDSTLLSYCDPVFIDCIAYLWNNFEDYHWEAQGPYVYKTDSLQFTAILIRELVAIEWKIRDDNNFFEVVKTITDVIQESSINHSRNSVMPTKKRVYAFIRGFTLLIPIVWLASIFTPLIIAPWKDIEFFFKEYQILTDLVAAALFAIITFALGRIFSESPMDTLKEYLGLEI